MNETGRNGQLGHEKTLATTAEIRTAFPVGAQRAPDLEVG
jgi:hypothetical protein